MQAPSLHRAQTETGSSDWDNYYLCCTATKNLLARSEFKIRGNNESTCQRKKIKQRLCRKERIKTSQHFSLPRAIQMIQPKVRKVPRGTGCCGMHVSMRCSQWTQRHLDVIEGRRKNSKLFLQAYFNYFACSYSSAPIPKLMFWICIAHRNKHTRTVHQFFTVLTVKRLLEIQTCMHNINTIHKWTHLRITNHFFTNYFHKNTVFYIALTCTFLVHLNLLHWNSQRESRPLWSAAIK